MRPIFHRLEDAARAHLFLCFLAYYVEWHLHKALAPILYDDEEREQTLATSDPVAPSLPSPKARNKKKKAMTEEYLPVHSF